MYWNIMLYQIIIQFVRTRDDWPLFYTLKYVNDLSNLFNIVVSESSATASVDVTQPAHDRGVHVAGKLQVATRVRNFSEGKK